MKMRSRIIIICLILWVILPLVGYIWYFAAASDGNDQIKRDMTSNMGVYVDKEGKKDFGQIDTVKFQDYLDSGVSGSLSDSIYWFKIDLPEKDNNNADATESNWLFEIAKPHLDSIFYRQVDKDGQILSEGGMGRKFPFSQRILKHPNYVIPLKTYNGSSTMYLSIQTKSYLQVPVSIWSTKDFWEVNVRNQLINGVFYGALIIMILYNIILGVSLKDKSYFYFVICVLSYTMLQTVWDGYSYQYFWPSSSRWDLMANPFFMNASSLGLLMFSKNFLQINKEYRILNKIYWTASSLALLAMVLIWLLPIRISVYIGLVIAFSAIITCVFSVFVKKVYTKSEIIYIIAWQVLMSSNLLSILAGVQIIPYTKVIMLFTKVGIILLIVLFSLALSERINQVEYQKSLETEKRILLNNLHEMNKRISGERDIFLAFKYLLTDFLNITGFEKGIAVLIGQDEKLSLDIYRNEMLGAQRVMLDEDQYKLLMESINEDKIGNLDKRFFESILGNTNIAVARTILLVNRGNRRGFIVLYSLSFQQIRPLIQEMVLDYANQFAMTIDNILLLSEITKVAQIDGLTQIYNRTHFFKNAQELFERVDRAYNLAALMIDVDYFKNVNDTYGHQAGDDVLKHIVGLIKEKLGARGIIGRYGGEEFVIVIPNQTQEVVKKMAKDILMSVEETPIIIQNSLKSHLSVTISIGIAFKNINTQSIFSLTEEADRALYRAKENGRNQVVESF